MLGYEKDDFLNSLLKRAMFTLKTVIRGYLLLQQKILVQLLIASSIFLTKLCAESYIARLIYVNLNKQAEDVGGQTKISSKQRSQVSCVLKKTKKLFI